MKARRGSQRKARKRAKVSGTLSHDKIEIEISHNSNNNNMNFRHNTTSNHNNNGPQLLIWQQYQVHRYHDRRIFCRLYRDHYIHSPTFP